MLSTKRKFLAVLALLPLAACGFTPAYAPGGPAAQLFDRVVIDAPTTKNAFDLVERLEERLGRAETREYRLTYRIETEETGLAVTLENATTRYNITGTVSFVLMDSAGKTLSDGKVTTFTAFSATGTAVSTRSAREDANLRLMRLLADQIVTRLIATGNAPAR